MTIQSEYSIYNILVNNYIAILYLFCCAKLDRHVCPWIMSLDRNMLADCHILPVCKGFHILLLFFSSSCWIHYWFLFIHGKNTLH